MTAPWIAAFVLQWMLLALLTLVVLGLLSKFSSGSHIAATTMSASVSHFNDGDKLPTLSLKDTGGNMVSFDELGTAGRGGVLLVSASGCQACEILVKQLAELDRRLGDLTVTGKQVLLVLFDLPMTKTPADSTVAQAATIRGVRLLLDDGQAALGTLGVSSVPTGIAFDAAGFIVSQSRNPHAGWLYQVLEVSPPSVPAYSGPMTLVLEETASGPTVSDATPNGQHLKPQPERSLHNGQATPTTT